MQVGPVIVGTVCVGAMRVGAVIMLVRVMAMVVMRMNSAHTARMPPMATVAKVSVLQATVVPMRLRTASPLGR